MANRQKRIKMQVVELSNNTTDVSLNLGIDHALFLLHNHPNELWIRYWVNQPSVILGKSQDFDTEVDYELCKRNHIQVKRRISGGGAVYHDLGNLNVSLIYDLPFFGRRTIPDAVDHILNSVKSSLQETYPERTVQKMGTSLFLDDKKISGSASYKKGRKILFHFTLLVDVNLKNLNMVLLARDPQPKSSRQSKYAPTINLENFDFNNWRKKFLKLLIPSQPTLGTANWKRSEGHISINLPSLNSEINLGNKMIGLAKFLKSRIYDNFEWTRNGRWASVYNQVKKEAMSVLGYNPF